MSYDGPPPTEPPWSDPPRWSGPLPYGNPPKPAPKPDQSRRWLLYRMGFAAMVVLFLAAGSTIWLARHSGVPTPPAPTLALRPQVSSDGTAEPAPAGAAAVTVAYLAAQESVRPAQLAVSRQLSNAGYVTSIDMTDQLAVDRKLTAAMRQIEFPAAIQPAARQYVDALSGYDDFLNLSASSASYYTSHQDDDAHQLSIRQSSEDQLRLALHLTAMTCVFDRP